jgi:hypothetical protein
MTKLPTHIMKHIREALGFDAHDERHDDEIMTRSANELFDLWCNYEGLINYGDRVATTLDCIRRAKMTTDPALDALKKIHNEEGTMWTLAIIKELEPTWKSAWDLRKERDAADEANAGVDEALDVDSTWIDRIHEVADASEATDESHRATFPESGKR